MKYVISEKKSNVILIKINRPEVLNALNYEVVSELSEVFHSISSDNDIKVVMLTGQGERSFCAGGDLRSVVDMTPIEAEKYALHVHNLLNMIENFDIPVIAAINGYALGGGCQLALACDLRLASKNAKIGQTEVTIGIPPGWGATQRLSRIVGISKAKEMIFTGKVISVYEAKRIGIVNEIIDHEINSNKSVKQNQEKISNQFFINKCILFSELISKNNSLPIRIAKKLVNKARDVDIDSGLLMERYGCSICFDNFNYEKLKNRL